MNCVSCDRPLICDACDAPFAAADAEQYHRLHTAELPVHCPACQALLVCHWCGTPYDGGQTPTDGEDDTWDRD